MRSFLALLLLASPAAAWEFTPVPVCTLSHEDGGSQVEVTYDPRRAEAYEIALTLPGGWTPGPVFALSFTGGRDLTISTNRHRLGAGGATLSVSDTGFGNVLDGLEFNATATALIADQAVSVSLAGAAEEVRRFRDCTEGGIA